MSCPALILEMTRGMSSMMDAMESGSLPSGRWSVMGIFRLDCVRRGWNVLRTARLPGITRSFPKKKEMIRMGYKAQTEDGSCNPVRICNVAGLPISRLLPPDRL